MDHTEDMMDQGVSGGEEGALPQAAGLSPSVESVPVSPPDGASIPNAYVTPPWERMWFDPECAEDGCQSLVWKARYEAAVQGRQDFRSSYRDQLELSRELLKALTALSDAVTLTALRGRNHVPTMRLLQDAQGAALGAIAKAEGR